MSGIIESAPAAALLGLGVGRVVHVVLENGVHRPGLVVAAPGMLVAVPEDGDGFMMADAPPDSGIIQAVVFPAVNDIEDGAFNSMGVPVGCSTVTLPSVGYEADGTTPYTWHWPERIN